MSPGNSSAGPLTTDRPTAENLDIAQSTDASDIYDGRQTGHLQQVRGCLVLVVGCPGGKYRRRTFLTLAAAERACRRAQEAGHVASVMVARLEPVAVIG